MNDRKGAKIFLMVRNSDLQPLTVAQKFILRTFRPQYGSFRSPAFVSALSTFISVFFVTKTAFFLRLGPCLSLPEHGV